MKDILRFADGEGDNSGKYWSEDSEGNRTESTTGLNQSYWFVWVMNSSKRYNEDGYLVFEFKEPLTNKNLSESNKKVTEFNNEYDK